MIATFVAFFSITIMALWLVRRFASHSFSQPQRGFIHDAEVKSRTKPIPCGGIVFFLCFAIYSVIAKGIGYELAVLAGFFCIGVLDDIGKVMKKSHISFLNGKWRLLIEIALSLVFVHFFLCGSAYTLTMHNSSIELHDIVSYPLLVFLIVGTVNAVNLTDGQDGLAGKTVLIHLFFLMTFAVSGQLIVLAGSLLAFLLFNSKPATIYMGDAGSMFLGAFLSMAFIQSKVEWLLPFTGIVFVIETLSVIMQVLYFRATKGRRIFKMSPFHHHLSLSGMSEEKITNLAFVVTIITCFTSYIFLNGHAIA